LQRVGSEDAQRIWAPRGACSTGDQPFGILDAARNSVNATSSQYPTTVRVDDRRGLGAALFERIGNTLALTTAGTDLVEHVRSMSDAATRVSRRHLSRTMRRAGVRAVRRPHDETVTRTDATSLKFRPDAGIARWHLAQTSLLDWHDVDVSLRPGRQKPPSIHGSSVAIRIAPMIDERR